MYKNYLKKAQQGSKTKPSSSFFSEKEIRKALFDRYNDLGRSQNHTEKHLKALNYLIMFDKNPKEADNIYQKTFGGNHKELIKHIEEIAPAVEFDISSFRTANGGKDIPKEKIPEISKSFYKRLGTKKETIEDVPTFYDIVYNNGAYRLNNNDKSNRTVGTLARNREYSDLFFRKNNFDLRSREKGNGYDVLVPDNNFTLRQYNQFENDFDKLNRDILIRAKKESGGSYPTKEVERPFFNQKGGMLQGNPHEMGGQVISDKEGNPIVEAEGGEIIFSVETSSMIDEGVMAYAQAKNNREKEAIANEIGKLVLEERLMQMENEMGGQDMEDEEQMAIQGMQRGGKIDIMKRLELLNEF